MKRNLKVNDLVYISSKVGAPYEKCANCPGKVLAVNAGAGGCYVYVEVMQRNGKPVRYLFFPDNVIKERSREFLALWRELARARRKLDRIAVLVGKLMFD